MVVVPSAVDVYVLTGSGRLVSRAAEIEERIRAAANACVAQLPLCGGVDIVVRDAPRLVIAEIGIGGFAPDGHTVFLALDPDHEKFDRAVDRELVPTVAHEFHHIARRQAGVRGHTLIDALVHEGLADHFAIQLTGVPAPPWAVALTPERQRPWPFGHARSTTIRTTTTRPGSSAAKS